MSDLSKKEYHEIADRIFDSGKPEARLLARLIKYYHDHLNDPDAQIPLGVSPALVDEVGKKIGEVAAKSAKRDAEIYVDLKRIKKEIESTTAFLLTPTDRAYLRGLRVL